MGEPVKRIVGHKSPYFQEEFPTLAASGSEGSDKPKDTGDKKDGEPVKEQQYGPGPSLRPQSKLTAIFYVYLVSLFKLFKPCLT